MMKKICKIPAIIILISLFACCFCFDIDGSGYGTEEPWMLPGNPADLKNINGSYYILKPVRTFIPAVISFPPEYPPKSAISI